MTRSQSIAGGAPLVLPHPFSARAGANQAHLRLMETTDLHVHIYPYDYYTDRPVDTVGLARTAAHVAVLRAGAANAMLLDDGDFLQGNPMGDYVAYERGVARGEAHPVIAAMNALGVDAATLGNHEFNYGLDFLTRSLAGAAFPVVSANVATRMGATPCRDRTLVPPYVILERRLIDGAGAAHPIRIGVIGLAPPQIVTWDRAHLEGRVQARDIVETARALVPQMREEGADLVVALSHSGIGARAHTEGMEHASVPLARVAGIDALMTGHSHLVFPSPDHEGVAGADLAAGTIEGKPAVMAGFWGSHLGAIELMLEREGGTWRVLATESATHPIARRETDGDVIATVDSRPEVLKSAAAVHRETLAYIRRPVGATSAPLHSYFALVADAPSLQLVCDAQAWYVERMLRGTEHEGLPILSAAAPFKAGGRGGPDFYTDIPAGPIFLKNVADLYLYPNIVRAVKVTGAQVKEWLERSAGLFNRIAPGAIDADLLNPDFPSHHFDVIAGVAYRIDLGRPAMYDRSGTAVHHRAGRIAELTFRGAPVDPAQAFIVATNSYRAGGGGDFPGLDGSSIVAKGQETSRDAVLRYVVEQGTVHPRADGNWRFASMPGTTAAFDTGPRARCHLAELQSVAIEEIGASENGFARFRIRL